MLRSLRTKILPLADDTVVLPGHGVRPPSAANGRPIPSCSRSSRMINSDNHRGRACDFSTSGPRRGSPVSAARIRGVPGGAPRLGPARRVSGVRLRRTACVPRTRQCSRVAWGSTDVVSKEMYIHRPGDRSIRPAPRRNGRRHALGDRAQPAPRATARQTLVRRSVLPRRAPAKGRYRQLQQVGVEAIGSDDPRLDAEVVALWIRESATAASRAASCCSPRWAAPSAARPTGNCSPPTWPESTWTRPPGTGAGQPAAGVDDKRGVGPGPPEQAPLMVDHLCTECAQHYDRVRPWPRWGALDSRPAAGARPGLLHPHDVRVRAFAAGAQSAIGGGGRYDGLMETLGGPGHDGYRLRDGTDRRPWPARPRTCPAGETGGHGLIVIGGRHRRGLLRRCRGRLRRAGVGTGTAFGGRG